MFLRVVFSILLVSSISPQCYVHYYPHRGQEPIIYPSKVHRQYYPTPYLPETSVYCGFYPSTSTPKSRYHEFYPTSYLLASIAIFTIYFCIASIQHLLRVPVKRFNVCTLRFPQNDEVPGISEFCTKFMKFLENHDFLCDSSRLLEFANGICSSSHGN